MLTIIRKFNFKNMHTKNTIAFFILVKDTQKMRIHFPSGHQIRQKCICVFYADRDTGRLGDRQAGRLADRGTRTQADWQTDRLADWQTGRPADWQTGRVRAWDTGRPGDRDTARPGDWKTGRLKAVVKVMNNEQGNIKVGKGEGDQRIAEWEEKPGVVVLGNIWRCNGETFSNRTWQ